MPVAVGDVLVTVAASIEIPAKIVFLHPIHNFTVLQYSVEAIGDTPMRSAQLSTSPVAVCAGGRWCQGVCVWGGGAYGPCVCRPCCLLLLVVACCCLLLLVVACCCLMLLAAAGLWIAPFTLSLVIDAAPPLTLRSLCASCVFRPTQAGANVLFVGLKDSSDPTPVYQSCVVTSKEGLYLSRSNPPRFRAFNEDVYNFDRYACTGGKRAPTPALSTSPEHLGGMYDTWISGSDVNSFCCYGFVYLLDSW